MRTSKGPYKIVGREWTRSGWSPWKVLGSMTAMTVADEIQRQEAVAKIVAMAKKVGAPHDQVRVRLNGSFVKFPRPRSEAEQPSDDRACVCALAARLYRVNAQEDVALVETERPRDEPDDASKTTWVELRVAGITEQVAGGADAEACHASLRRSLTLLLSERIREDACAVKKYGSSEGDQPRADQVTARV